MNKPFNAPQDFTAKFPNYVYRDSKGRETVQWRQAALEMANDRAKLIEALRKAMHQVAHADDCRAIQALLVEIGEAK
jgi:hypothetical protein